MHRGWEGSWAWQNRYTTESSPTAYLFLFWIVLGHIAALTNLPLVVVFHLARVAGAIALMAGAGLFISHFIEDRAARRFALFFVGFWVWVGLVLLGVGSSVVFFQPTAGLR